MRRSRSRSPHVGLRNSLRRWVSPLRPEPAVDGSDTESVGTLVSPPPSSPTPSWSASPGPPGRVESPGRLAVEPRSPERARWAAAARSVPRGPLRDFVRRRLRALSSAPRPASEDATSSPAEFLETLRGPWPSPSASESSGVAEVLRAGPETSECVRPRDPETVELLDRFPRVPFSKALFSGEPYSERCPVCMEDFGPGEEKAIVLTPCLHAFHLCCLGGWLERRRGGHRCPTCRWDVSNDGALAAFSRSMGSTVCVDDEDATMILDSEGNLQEQSLHEGVVVEQVETSSESGTYDTEGFSEDGTRCSSEEEPPEEDILEEAAGVCSDDGYMVSDAVDDAVEDAPDDTADDGVAVAVDDGNCCPSDAELEGEDDDRIAGLTVDEWVAWTQEATHEPLITEDLPRHSRARQCSGAERPVSRHFVNDSDNSSESDSESCD